MSAADLTLTSFGRAQVPVSDSAAQTRYVFDVVSIRPSAKDGFSRWRVRADGYLATNVTAQQLLFDAFQTEDPDSFNHIISFEQIRGLPKWGDAQQFDVTAKVDEQTMARLSRFSELERKKLYQMMLLPVLKERFNLEAHHEKREQAVYLLQTAQEGSKLVQSDVPFDKSSLSVGRSQIHAKGFKVDQLIETLAQSVGRIVVDETHLTGTYDFDLKWSPDTPTDMPNSSPSIYTALTEQLGLRLVSSRGLVDSILVTQLDLPSPN